MIDRSTHSRHRRGGYLSLLLLLLVINFGAFVTNAQLNGRPSLKPTIAPSTAPTFVPSFAPSALPSALPTAKPSPLYKPSPLPTVLPSPDPTALPSPLPTKRPTPNPSPAPSPQPSANPSPKPTLYPTSQPSSRPSMQPSSQPSMQPSSHPSMQPSRQPTTQPSSQPSLQPFMDPTSQPSIQPSVSPTVQPSSDPTMQPSSQPSMQPSRQPSTQPSRQPSSQPSSQPSRQPSSQPSMQPSRQPSSQPSMQPTSIPSMQPSSKPSMQPSGLPSRQPSSQPSKRPTTQPSRQPSRQPSSQPSRHPSSQPSANPSNPSSQPSRQPSLQPQSRPSLRPSPKPTPLVNYDQTKRYASISPEVYDAYTEVWKSTHGTWLGVTEQTVASCTKFNEIPRSDPTFNYPSSNYDFYHDLIFPTCSNGVVLDLYGGGQADRSCPKVQCDVGLDGCPATPSDTVDYLPPPQVSSTVTDFHICVPPELDSVVTEPFYGMDAGLPPDYTPVFALRLELRGYVRGKTGQGRCDIIPGAMVQAWQVDPTKLDSYDARSEFMGELAKSKEEKKVMKKDRSDPDIYHDPDLSAYSNVSSGLRTLTCRGQVRTEANGTYFFRTTVPPSYGPPRHIVVTVSAPGYETITTRLYFESDWRLQQLTDSNENGENPSLYSMKVASGFANDWLPNASDTYGSQTRGKRSVVSRDMRVTRLTWVEAQAVMWNGVLASKGHFKANFNITLNPLRPSNSENTTRTPPVDINGLWIDRGGGYVNIESRGNRFYAIEYPHARSWAMVAGTFTGDTIRGVDFFSESEYRYGNGEQNSTQSFDINTVVHSQSHQPLKYLNPVDAIWSATGRSVGSIQLADSFSTNVIGSDPNLQQLNRPAASKEISIQWLGGGYNSIWTKVNDPSDIGYRYLKIVVTRETGGRKGGVLAINEIEFYEGILEQRRIPLSERKMKNPRTFFQTGGAADINSAEHQVRKGVNGFSAPQIVTCSSFQDQASHCYKAFDGDESSGSVWLSNPVGSKDHVLVAPQWILLDLGAGRGARPTALRILCDQSDASSPKGCPMTFQLLGSHDNNRFDMLYSEDLFDYKNDYGVSHGKTFHFGWDTPTGRHNGHRCGSCDLGPKFTCNINAYDGSCQSKFCSRTGFCGKPIDCPAGQYMVKGFDSYDSPSFECRLCAPGRFGNRSGLVSPLCSGLCDEGYYCSAGSSTPKQHACGHPGVYCPQGTGIPVPASVGRRTVFSWKEPHPRYQPTALDLSTMISEKPCAKGHYCTNGKQYQCPVGRYGDREGLESNLCVEKCLTGEYCPPGSVVPTICEPGFYCPDGNTRVACPAGSFGAIRGLLRPECSGECAAGFFCDVGSTSPRQMPCPAGRYGREKGVQSSVCSGECQEGFFCPAASTNSTSRPCGDPSVYCPKSSPEPTPVKTGYYSVEGAPELRVRELPCEQGYYCKGGVKYACPSGSFGADVGMSNLYALEAASLFPSALPTLAPSQTLNPSRGPTTFSATRYPTSNPTSRPSTSEEQDEFICSGVCESGYFCPANSTSSRQLPCPPGRFGSTVGLKDSLCTDICPLGHFCPLGSVLPTKCPAGYFGNATGVTDSSCSQVCFDGICDKSAPMCQEGFYCPEGSVTATQEPCGGAAFFCPRGAPLPVPVSEGFYTVGPFPTQNQLTRTDQVKCEPGFYCSRGLKLPCPAGRFGNTSGLPSASCSGPCSPGYYCPTGSYNATMYRCPAGRYGATYGLQNSACSGVCQKGFYCPEASIAASEMRCGTVLKIPAYDVPRYLSMFDINVEVNQERNNMQVSDKETINNLLRVLFRERFRDDGLNNIVNSPITGFRPGKSVKDFIEPLEGGYQTTMTLNAHSGEAIDVADLSSIYQVQFRRNQSASEVVFREPNLVYCPIGSMLPIEVLPGYYSVGQDRYTRSDQLPCPLGSYCTEGVMRDCPAGTFGITERLQTPACSGLCQKGYYCPEGSRSRTESPCPLGYYGDKEGLTGPKCSGACAQALLCPVGSITESPLPSRLSSDVW